jgi:hypothetical protein
MKRVGRIVRPVVGAFILLLATWFVLKEAIEPHWAIRLADLARPGPPPLVLPLNDGLALHLYTDTRPHIGKITPVQKGLALAQDGQELIEEGYGFGAPIVIFGGRAYLSRHAEVLLGADGRSATKRFRMDIEDTWTELLRPKYRLAAPLGAIVFTYTATGPGNLEVAVDFSELTITPELIYLTNEQGAGHFRRYSDSAGVDRLLIDAPDTPDQWVLTHAARACFTATERRLRFCVETAPDQPKYIGRERYLQFRWTGAFALSWAGVDIELARPAGVYRYKIHIEAIPEG